MKYDCLLYIYVARWSLWSLSCWGDGFSHNPFTQIARLCNCLCAAVDQCFESQFAKLIKNGPPKLKWTRFQHNGWLMMLHSGWVAEVLYIVSLFSLHHRAMYTVGTTAKWVVWIWTFWYKLFIFNDLNNHQLNVLRL